MHDFELVEHARLTMGTAGPHQYQALCVLVARLCDEIERIERLRLHTGVTLALRDEAAKDLVAAARNVLKFINSTDPKRMFNGTEMPFNVLRLAYAQSRLMAQTTAVGKT